MNWISVSDRLPEEDGYDNDYPIWVKAVDFESKKTVNEYWCSGNYFRMEGLWDVEMGNDIKTPQEIVTHWLPIEPPKGGRVKESALEQAEIILYIKRELESELYLADHYKIYSDNCMFKGKRVKAKTWNRCVDIADAMLLLQTA